MHIALIRNQICENVAIFDSLESAHNMLGQMYDFIVVCPDNRGIGHRYIDHGWHDPETVNDAQ